MSNELSDLIEALTNAETQYEQARYELVQFEADKWSDPSLADEMADKGLKSTEQAKKQYIRSLSKELARHEYEAKLNFHYFQRKYESYTLIKEELNLCGFSEREEEED